VVDATRALARIDKEAFRRSLVVMSRSYTAQADLEFDEHGKVIRKSDANDAGLPDTIVVDQASARTTTTSMLFDAGPAERPTKTRRPLDARNRSVRKGR